MPELIVFLPTLRGGGAERNMLRLSGGLASAGFDVTVAVADTRGPNRDWVPDNVTFVDLHAKLLPTSIVPLAWLLRRRRPDLLISALNGANVVALAARNLVARDLPTIVSERNTLSQWVADSRGLKRRIIIPWLVKRLYPSAQAIVGVSDGVADDLAEFTGLPRDRILSIPNPVVDERLAQRADEPIPSAWHTIIGTAPLVVTVGRLVPHKDHATLLEAFTRVRAVRDDVHLAILGEGPQLDTIAGDIDRRGLTDVVHLVGFQANPYSWMRRADVLAMASRYEGLPTVLIEALACGAQVVATDCPSGAAEILAGGKWGRLVSVGDAHGLSEGILDALADGRWQQPPQAALDPYRPERVLATFRQLIEQLVTPAGTSG